MSKYCYSPDGGFTFQEVKSLPRKGVRLSDGAKHTNLALLPDIMLLGFGWYKVNEINPTYDASSELREIDSKVLNGTVLDITYKVSDILATWFDIEHQRSALEQSDIQVVLDDVNYLFHADIDSYMKLRGSFCDFSFLVKNPGGVTITWKTKSLEEEGAYVYKDVNDANLRTILTAIVLRTQALFNQGEVFRSNIGTVTKKTIMGDWGV